MRLLLLLLLTASACRAPGAANNVADLRVMSFNIRYGSADDGTNSWPLRHGLVMDVVEEFEPDVLGLQEALRFQLDEIEAEYPHLGEVGVGRDDGETRGEYSAILYDRERLRLVEQGTFWLSDTPERIASTSWGNSITRICTWARFEDREAGGGFHVFNTHWDHRSQPSRERSALLILERIREVVAGGPVLVLGDFNAGEGNPAFRTLVTDGELKLADSFRRLHPAQVQAGTFNGFEGTSDGEKIDALLFSPHWQVLEAEIVRDNRDGRYPSDHFPVSAVVAVDPR